MLARTLCAAALLAAGTALAADPPPPGGIPDIVGPRALGLSAAMGAVVGNEGLYLNPGAIAARKRYSVELGGVLDRRGAETVDQIFGGSVIDSVTNEAVGAGFSYLRARKGVFTGNVFHGALGAAVVERMWFGVGGKYFSLDGPDGQTRAATADAGFLWQVADLVSIGAAGYNLVPIGNEGVAPMGAGAGIAIGSEQSFQVTADWRGDFDRHEQTKNRYAAGAELLLARFVPVRAGWMRDEVLDTSWWSAGIGVVTATGVALDVGYRQSLDDKSARTIAASLKLFLLQ